MLDLTLYYTIRERHRLASPAGKPGGLQRLPEVSVPSLYRNQPRTGATAGKCPPATEVTSLPREPLLLSHTCCLSESASPGEPESPVTPGGALTRSSGNTARCRHTGGTNPTQYEAHYDPDSWMKTSLPHGLATDSHWGLELHSHVSRPLTRGAQLQPPPTHGRAGRPSACAPRAPLVCG